MELPVGACDAELLRARAALLGTELEAFSPCPGCGQKMGFSVTTPELLESPGARPTGELLCGDLMLRFRVATYRDLIAASESEDVATVRAGLLRRCLTVVSTRDGATTTLDPACLPEEAVDRVGAAMSEADPQADLRVTLSCAECSRRWQEMLDVGAFFWAELQVLARRLLDEVHTLAARYGWAESDILDMTPRRRQAYLQMGEA